MIRQAKITEDATAIPLFTQGIPFKTMGEIMMHNPTTLEEWYELALHSNNIRNHMTILANLSGAGKGSHSRKYRDPDAMDVNIVALQATVTLKTVAMVGHPKGIGQPCNG